MGKSKKKSSASLQKDGKGHRSSNSPRLNQIERQLHRFYEPLVLMHTLGNVREEHSYSALFSHLDISELPVRDIRRQFLADLAYLCDYKKGGDTVTAIGLERTPQGCVYWVAANTSPDTKIVPFLKELLNRLRGISRKQYRCLGDTEDALTESCLEFANRRLKDYCSLLKPQLAKCVDYLEQWELEDMTGLIAWLKEFGSRELEPVALCRLAYRDRRNNFMRQLKEWSKAPIYKSSSDAIHKVFQLTRHYIGRLGYHIRAVKTLVSCAPSMICFLDEFDVESIPTPSRAPGLPPPDRKTRLNSMLVRMLPANSPRLAMYQKAMAERDAAFNIMSRMLETYRDRNLRPRVHAELLVLQHFHENDLTFEDCDKYIACSKPACYCCALYFRHHGGDFEQPPSHNKLYLNWRPPGFDHDLQSGSDEKWREQRDILNTMTEAIRRDVLHQIFENQPARGWHPDSVTGISESVWRERDIISISNVVPSPRSPLVESSSAESDIYPSERWQMPLSSPSYVSDGDSEVEGGVALPPDWA